MEKDYEVLCRLGEGSFGKVYKARHRRTGDEVAVKQIKIGSRSWDEACRSTELQALKTLRHPFIVRLRELIRSQLDGSLYYIFEFVSSDLFRLMKDNPGGLDEMRCAVLVRQLFAGLAHMHQYNFFHRDMKPENVLFDAAHETIRIADFGEARSLRARPPFTDYVGTRWYRAPECLLKDRAYSSPVDIWASGLIFAELLRGSPVFSGTSTIDQLHRIFTVLGHTLNDWPEFTRLSQNLRFRMPDRTGCGIARVVRNGSSKCIALLTEIIALNPRRRPLAKKCLEHSYFSVLPALDLDRLDNHQAQNSQLAADDSCEDKSLPLDAFDDKSIGFDDRRLSKDSVSLGDKKGSKDSVSPSGKIPSKELVTSNSTKIAPDLDVDLDAELDAILGDTCVADSSNNKPHVAGTDGVRRGYSDAILADPDPQMQPATLNRNFSRASTVPNLDTGLSRTNSFASTPTARGRTPGCNTEASTAATVGDTSISPERPVAQKMQRSTSPHSPGAVSVDALLDSLCADFPDEEQRRELRHVENPPPPNPNISLDIPVPTAKESISNFSASVSTQPLVPEWKENVAVGVATGQSRDLHVRNDTDAFIPASSPAVEVAWPGTPPQVSEKSEQPDSPPLWQPSERPRGSRSIAPPPPLWGEELPTSPSSDSSGPDAEAEILLPGLHSLPKQETSVNAAGKQCVPAASTCSSDAVSASKGESTAYPGDTASTAKFPTHGGGDAYFCNRSTRADRAPVGAGSILGGSDAPAQNYPTLPYARQTGSPIKSASEKKPIMSPTNRGLETHVAAHADAGDGECSDSGGTGGRASIAQTRGQRSRASVAATVGGTGEWCDSDFYIDQKQPVQMPSPLQQDVSSDNELEKLRSENAALRKLLDSSPGEKTLSDATPWHAVTGPSSSKALAAVKTANAALAAGLDVSKVNTSKTKAWSSEEAKHLKQIVKRVVRKGTRDKAALWTEVSAELGNGRSAKECKSQYARDYRTHKAKNNDAGQTALTGELVVSASVGQLRAKALS